MSIPHPDPKTSQVDEQAREAIREIAVKLRWIHLTNAEFERVAALLDPPTPHPTSTSASSERTAQVLKWPEDLTTLVGKRITARPKPDTGCIDIPQPMLVIGLAYNGQMEISGVNITISTAYRDLISIEDPTPVVEKQTEETAAFTPELLPSGMLPIPSQWPDDYFNLCTKDLRARDTQWRTHCASISSENERLTKERDEAQQRHDGLCHENEKMKSVVEAARWVLNDMRCKAPETTIGMVGVRWDDRLSEALDALNPSPASTQKGVGG